MRQLVREMILSKGHVFGFDIQKEAIIKTQELLKNYSNVTLYQKSHDEMDFLNLNGKVSLIIFNLGYLPGGNKNITTKATTTLKAIKKSLNLLNQKGKILVVFYPHIEGKKEANTVLNWLKNQNYNYFIKRNTDQENAPFLLVITKDLINR